MRILRAVNNDRRLLLFPCGVQGKVDTDGAIMLVEPRHLDQLLHPMFENEKAYQRDVITKGLGASPGAAVGKLVFTAGERAVVCHDQLVAFRISCHLTGIEYYC
jgi:phosphoenolpyruvate synthase/pyruvate phosphate dikinase